MALDAGYGAHEAFTRAFRGQFGLTPAAFRDLTPAAFRDKRIPAAIDLTEPIPMTTTQAAELDPPRYETGPALLIAGLGGRYRAEPSDLQGGTIPDLWQRFEPYLGQIPGQIGFTTYGVCHNADGTGNFDYLAGVEVASFDAVPAEFARVRLVPRRYAVFTHRGHIAGLRNTVQAIWTRWLPASGHKLAAAPDFERYDETFKPATGPVEIWLPIEA